MKRHIEEVDKAAAAMVAMTAGWLIGWLLLLDVALLMWFK